MAGDIEEFLRRAAERRQQRANQRNVQQQQAARPAAPQYTDRAAERVPRPAPVYQPPVQVQQVEPLMAEVIEDDEHESMSNRRKTREAADQSKIDTELQRHSHEGEFERSQKGQQSSAVSDLVRLLKSPNGMKQAILLREILEPRSNMWD